MQTQIKKVLHVYSVQTLRLLECCFSFDQPFLTSKLTDNQLNFVFFRIIDIKLSSIKPSFHIEHICYLPAGRAILGKYLPESKYITRRILAVWLYLVFWNKAGQRGPAPPKLYFRALNFTSAPIGVTMEQELLYPRY